jgi:hypothetical protein
MEAAIAPPTPRCAPPLNGSLPAARERGPRRNANLRATILAGREISPPQFPHSAYLRHVENGAKRQL